MFTGSGANNPSGTQSDECMADEEDIKTINEFLENTVFLGRNLFSKTTYDYAYNLYKAGFETVEMIQIDLTENHIQNFDWIHNEIHKGIMISKVKEFAVSHGEPLQPIRDFLNNYIFNGSGLPATIGKYAKDLFDEGFDTVGFIKDPENLEDLEEYISGGDCDWKSIHKKKLLKKVKKIHQEV